MANERNRLLLLTPWLVEFRKMVSKVTFTFSLNCDVAHLICGCVYRQDGFNLEDAYLEYFWYPFFGNLHHNRQHP